MKTPDRNESAKKIAVLNDAFRTMVRGGRVVMTAGVNELPESVKVAALKMVVEFNDFTDGNDPYREHDFGSFELVNQTFFWKIDLYEEPDIKNANGEPVVMRVLTIMLAEEY